MKTLVSQVTPVGYLYSVVLTDIVTVVGHGEITGYHLLYLIQRSFNSKEWKILFHLPTFFELAAVEPFAQIGLIWCILTLVPVAR